jgi:hypothetical protein
LILYNNANEIITLQKLVYVNYFMIVKIFEKKINNLLKKPYESQLHVNGSTIFNFFTTKYFYKKNDVQQK